MPPGEPSAPSPAADGPGGHGSWSTGHLALLHGLHLAKWMNLVSPASAVAETSGAHWGTDPSLMPRTETWAQLHTCQKLVSLSPFGALGPVLGFWILDQLGGFGLQNFVVDKRELHGHSQQDPKRAQLTPLVGAPFSSLGSLALPWVHSTPFPRLSPPLAEQMFPAGWWGCKCSVIPVTCEAEIGRITIPGQPGQKVHETPSQPIRIWLKWCMPVIPAMWEV
jgi:hypothetical protein